jgi:hypothetical protein
MLRLKFTDLSLALCLLSLIFTLVTGNPINPVKPRDEPSNTKPHWIHGLPHLSAPPGYTPGTAPGRYFTVPTQAAEKRHPPLEVGVDLLRHGPADVHVPEAVEGKRTPPSDLDSLGHVSFEGFHHDPLQDREMTRFPPVHPLPFKTFTSETPLLSAAGNVEPCNDDPAKACFVANREPFTVGSWAGANGQPSPPSKPGSVIKRIPPPDPLRPAKTLTGDDPLLSAAANVQPCGADPAKACFILNGQPVTVGNWIPTGAATQLSPPPKGAQPGSPPAGANGQPPLSSKPAHVTQPSPLASAVVYPVQCSADADMACIFVAGQPVTVGTWEPTGATTQTPLPSKTGQIADEETHRKHHSHPHPPPSLTTLTIPSKSASEIGTITVITDGKGPETGSFTAHGGTVTLTATAEPPTSTGTALHVHATYFSPLDHLPRREAV